MAIETECTADRTYTIGTLLEALNKSLTGNSSLDKSPLSRSSCIFKVPEVLRRHNPKAYKPDVVAIGPLHPHSDEKFQYMETVKQWYSRKLLERIKINGVEEFMDITEFEKKAREFYAEPLEHLTQSEFIEIMILDGCFVIQLLWNIVNDEIDDDDPIFNMDCMFQYVCHDLLLLENQLPWFVLSCLYSLTFGKFCTHPFSKILLDAFRSQKSLEKCLKDPENKLGYKGDDNGPLHILDLIRTSIVCKSAPSSGNDHGPSHRLDLICEPSSGNNQKKNDSEIPPATALSEAGVKFNSSDNNLMNIVFTKNDGVLTIPELALGELTEPLFRNLIAFEQCYHDRGHQITSYAVFMDKLISSKEDIKLLSEKKILGNWLNVEDHSKFFNSLYIDTAVKNFEYGTLCGDLNDYYDVKWNKYIEQFKRDYCSTPWKVIALIVGILILCVQLLQFIISVQSSTLFKGIRVNELSADI